MAMNWLDRLCADEDDPLLATSTVIVVPHPDDETIGLGGRLARLEGAIFIYVTDGAPRNMLDATAAGFSTRQAYAQARRDELTAALAVAGIQMCQTRTLELIDQEASLDLVGLTERLSDMLSEIHVDLVLLPPYEGGHPDHDAAAFAVHSARELLQGNRPSPLDLVEYTLYHDKYGAMSSCEFLPFEDCDERTLVLSESERSAKRSMLACFTTQHKTLAAFDVQVERLRHAPRYNFAEPPHPGTLNYERHDWGMTGSRWRSLAQEAADRLKIDIARSRSRARRR